MARTWIGIGLALALTTFGGCAIARWLLPEPRSIQRARGSIEQILFLVNDRVLIRNELGEMFVSNLDGRSWSKLADRTAGLALARNGVLWGANGWPGHHECPSGTTWYSSNGGDNWITTKLKVPCDYGSMDVNARLPGAFIHEPSEEPLLLMFNLQLMRPKPGEDIDSWQSIGNPIPDVEPLWRWMASGIQSRGIIYVAAGNRIFMTSDSGQTWSASRMHPFIDAKIRCHANRCYALLSQLGSRWGGLFATEHGRNEWQPITTFDSQTVAPVVTKESRVFGAVEAFGPNALWADKHGVLVAGMVSANRTTWGVILSVKDDGTMQILGNGLPFGIWDLVRAPDQTLWAASMGVHKWTKDGWLTLWADPKAEIAAQPGP